MNDNRVFYRCALRSKVQVYTRDISTLERGEFKVESFMATRMCNVCKKNCCACNKYQHKILTKKLKNS